MNNNLIRLICLFHFYLFPLDLLLFFLLVCLAYRESWTLDAWSESLDFRQLDAYTLDALTLDDSTLGAWTLDNCTTGRLDYGGLDSTTGRLDLRDFFNS